MRVWALVAITAAVVIVAVVIASARAEPRPVSPEHVKCATVQACRDRIAHLERAVAWQRHERLRRWAPSVRHAIGLAAVTFGVSERAMMAVAYCESRLNPGATNGQYLGLYQLGSTHRADALIVRFGWRDPYAQALHTARVVARAGSWRPWECQP